MKASLESVIAEATETARRLGGNPADWVGSCRGAPKFGYEARRILNERAAAQSVAVVGQTTPVVDPTTPAGAEFLAMVGQRHEFREPRIQRDTGICNRCGYESVECDCHG